MTSWRRWLERPQGMLLRRVLFQVHLWMGIAFGIYLLVICLTGSILVYRNELYRTFSPVPVIVSGSGTPLDAEAVKSAARRAYPDHEVTDVHTGKTPNHAIEITLRRGSETMRRLLHPFTGADLGNPVPVGYRFTAWMLDLHDNLLTGDTGRAFNGIGALALALLSLSGAIIWWPGIGSWRRSLIPDPRANWKRLNWTLHSALGAWGLLFLLLWGLTGMYLSFPNLFVTVFDWLEPFDPSNEADRIVDRIQYWLAYLHFGRLGGRGIPGCGRGLCDNTTKFIWAVWALVPPLMVVTGAIMWWNRVIQPKLKR